ncbi:MAG: PaaI family thioesterase [Promethearchaeota archaeon]
MNSINPNYKESVKKILRGAPFIQYVGYELYDLGPGWCETSLNIKNHHLQQDNYIHAGIIATMADHTAGMASLTLVQENQIVLTIEFKINFIRPAIGELLMCKSKVLRNGKTIIVTESEIFASSAEDQKLVAKAIVTLAVIDK